MRQGTENRKGYWSKLLFRWKIHFRISVSVEHLSLMINRAAATILCKWHVKLHKAHKSFHAISLSTLMYSTFFSYNMRYRTKWGSEKKFPNEYFIKKLTNTTSHYYYFVVELVIEYGNFLCLHFVLMDSALSAF